MNLRSTISLFVMMFQLRNTNSLKKILLKVIAVLPDRLPGRTILMNIRHHYLKPRARPVLQMNKKNPFLILIMISLRQTIGLVLLNRFLSGITTRSVRQGKVLMTSNTTITLTRISTAMVPGMSPLEANHRAIYKETAAFLANQRLTSGTMTNLAGTQAGSSPRI